MTQQEMEKAVDLLMGRFDTVNAYFIKKVAKQIKQIGELIPSTASIVTIMAEMNEDIADINAQLAAAVQITVPELHKLYKKAMDDNITDPRFARALAETPLAPASKARLYHYAETVSRQTAGAVYNLSNTTLTSLVYRQTADEAILAVSSGMVDYKSATREAIRRVGYGGLQMQYPSGYHRRLDSAIRQNIIDGVNQIAMQGSIMMGEELGYDAYEISAHARSAPDHEPVQGRVFLKEEFEKLQSDMPFQDVDGNRYEAIRRPIGEWNCMHIAMAFSTKHSRRRYSDATLKKYADDNAQGCVIDGKKYTIYQASQLMRRLETEVRREKDVANAAKAAGDMDLRKACQVRINALTERYKAIAAAASITQRRDRMMVADFDPVKV